MWFQVRCVLYVLVMFLSTMFVAEAEAQTPFVQEPGAFGSEKFSKGGQYPGRIERRSLPPLSHTPGNHDRPNRRFETTGLPQNLWKGLSLPEIENWFSKVAISAKSDTLHDLLIRLYLADVDLPTGQIQAEARSFNNLKFSSLYRVGRFQEIVEWAQNSETLLQDPVLHTYYAWSLLALGRNDQSCEQAQLISLSSTAMNRNRKALALMLNSYCSASRNEAEAATLASDLAGEQGANVQIPNTILYRLSTGEKNKLEVPKQFTLLDYAFLRLTQWQPHPALFSMSETPMLISISHDSGVPELTRLQALEAAAKRKAVSPGELSDLYLSQVFSNGELDRALTNPSEFLKSGANADSRLRALLFQAIGRAKEDRIRAQLISALLENGREAGMYGIVARTLAPAIESLPHSSNLVDWAESLIEALAVSRRFKPAADWAIFASASLQNSTDGLLHWLTLIDIAENDHTVSSDRALQIATEVARVGKFNKHVLHRLISVLDALNYKISIPLWDIASREPQPVGGFLPESGHLSHLMGAANRGETGKTIFLAMLALGPEGPASTHIIALSDTIRALMIAGLEAEARQVGFEALIKVWPRRRSG